MNGVFSPADSELSEDAPDDQFEGQQKPPNASNNPSLVVDRNAFTLYDIYRNHNRKCNIWFPHIDRQPPQNKVQPARFPIPQTADNSLESIQYDPEGLTDIEGYNRKKKIWPFYHGDEVPQGNTQPARYLTPQTTLYQPNWAQIPHGVYFPGTSKAQEVIFPAANIQNRQRDRPINDQTPKYMHVPSYYHHPEHGLVYTFDIFPCTVQHSVSSVTQNLQHGVFQNATPSHPMSTPGSDSHEDENPDLASEPPSLPSAVYSEADQDCDGSRNFDENVTNVLAGYLDDSTTPMSICLPRVPDQETLSPKDLQMHLSLRDLRDIERPELPSLAINDPSLFPDLFDLPTGILDFGLPVEGIEEFVSENDIRETRSTEDVEQLALAAPSKSEEVIADYTGEPTSLDEPQPPNAQRPTSSTHGRRTPVPYEPTDFPQETPKSTFQHFTPSDRLLPPPPGVKDENSNIYLISNTVYGPGTLKNRAYMWTSAFQEVNQVQAPVLNSQSYEDEKYKSSVIDIARNWIFRPKSKQHLIWELEDVKLGWLSKLCHFCYRLHTHIAQM
ncbi:hypothetical protein AA313_de0207626 [Arthrobotrys entomopaga]|nr:hypothetical protein AA313_de0207626 [Arthrobotrys entomopaga]